MLIEVPRLKNIPFDLTPHLQDRLSGITEILTRISKLVVEDLERAVCAVVGQDIEGKTQTFNRPSSQLLSYCLCFLTVAPTRFPAGEEAHSGCGSQSGCPEPPWWKGRPECL